MRRRDVDPEKLLEMIRSILPSRARESARVDKAHERRVVRRGVRQALHTEDAEETAVDFTVDADQSGNVSARRSSDKLHHFMRWCEALTEGLSDKDAIDFVRGILPDNLIGDHALSHWESYCKYGRGKRTRVPYREQQARLLQSFYDRTRKRLLDALRDDPDFLGRLNAAIKAGALGAPALLLHGVHEVDAFVRALIVDGAERRGLPVETSLERGVLFRLLDEHAVNSGPKRPVVLLRKQRQY